MNTLKKQLVQVSMQVQIFFKISSILKNYVYKFVEKIANDYIIKYGNVVLERDMSR